MTKPLATVAAMAVLMTAAWDMLAASAARPTAPLGLTVVASGAGLALMIVASQLIRQLCGALGVAIGVCGLSRRQTDGFGPVAVGASVVLLGTLFGNAVIYAGFTTLLIALLVVASLTSA